MTCGVSATDAEGEPWVGPLRDEIQARNMKYTAPTRQRPAHR
jgi:hypothetical protein